MNNLTYPKQVTKNNQFHYSNMGWMLSVVLFFLTVGVTSLQAQCLTVKKELLGVAVASSGIAGNIDVTYRITVINPVASSCPLVTGIGLTDQFGAAGNLGTTFVRIVNAPTASATGLSVATTIDPAFNGTTNNNMTNNDGFLFSDDSIVYRVTIELNPRASGAPVNLNNQAIVSYAVPLGGASASSNIVTIPNCWSNCQLACNNTVHVSVNSMCEAYILADMVLEGDYGSCINLGFFSVSLTYNGANVSMPLNKSYVGKKLTVSVKNIVCGNSCWGYLLVEDKIPPALNCKLRDTFRCNVNLNPSSFGFPVNAALVNQTVYPYIVTGIDACGTVRLTYHDSVVSYSCADTLASTVYRKWCATDEGGFTACCTDTIDIARGTLADITLPPHYDGQPGNLPALKCNGNWTKFANGNPDTTATGTGRPQGLLCGNIQFDFSDDTLRVCPGTFKLLRKWLIIDWCRPNNRVTYVQLIKVVDDVKPLVICPSTITINTNPSTCTGSYLLPVPLDLKPGTVIDSKIPYVIEECSGWTYEVKHRPATSPTNCTPDPSQPGTTQNITKLANGQYRVDNMPFGCNWIYYKICDGCGNCTECTFDIEVKDLTPPVAICQQRTVVSLTENGQATIPATVFDDHSLDNCEMGSFLARRMNPGPCGSTNAYTNTLTFCCADIASSPIRIILRVTDKAGNTAECMVDVMVQDKLPPRISCPRDTVVNCETDISNLAVFGTATATDNCSVNLTNRVENFLTACNTGDINRWFIATDAGGRKDSCFQKVIVRDINPFTGNDITWPADINLVGCKNATGVDVTGKPTYRNQDKCNQIVTNHEDLVFNYVEGVCYKILRKWTVIDWCTYDVNNPNSGRGVWYHTQVIKIVNNEKPTITSSCANRELCITDNCSVTAVLTASATDDCTNQDELLWSYSIDKLNDGSVDQTGNSRTLSTTLIEGKHKITWTVSDQCGNSTTCSYIITVVDCKAPTPYCNAGIVTVIMPSSREVTIWAKDFNVGSFDNCTEAAKLKYSFTSNVADSFKTIHCTDLDNGRADTFIVDIYVTDLRGNQDVCHTTLIVQDNQNVCPDKFGNTSSVAGLISGVNKTVLAGNVPVQFYTINSNSMQEKVTDQAGQYAFVDIAKNESYMVKPQLNTDMLNGVTTRDIVAIQKHILGKEFITNPYYLIAADVNKSGSITSRDISDIRKLILGLTTEFPNNNPSWNFVDAKYPITLENAFSYPSVININALTNAINDNNFVIVKTGDVTGEASTNHVQSTVSRSQKITGLESFNSDIEPGEEINIEFKLTENSEIEGMQFELRLAADVARFEGVFSDLLSIDENNYSISEGGKVLRLSWNDNNKRSYSAGSTILKFKLKGVSGGQINGQTLALDSHTIQNELYTTAENRSLRLLFRNSENAINPDYELFRNVPNPFTGKTTVYFKVPADQKVDVRIFDLSGKQVYWTPVLAHKGLNTEDVELQTETGGVLYYQLDADGFIATRKMVIIR